MKKTIVSLIFAAIASVSALVYAGSPINPSELPEAAKNFLSKYFATDNVKKVEKEQGRRGMEFEVDLSSGAEVDFTEKGDWKEVKSAKGSSVPADIVPAAITKHITANYSDQKIIEISRKRGGYEVKLSNGSELRLTEDAKPMQAREGGNRGNRK